MPRRIAFINEKGGSGKTTLVANLAVYLALRRGHRVLAIDMDPQGQLGKVLGLEVRHSRMSAIALLVDDAAPLEPTLGADPGRRLPPWQPARVPNLDVVVANKSLALFPDRTGCDGNDPTAALRDHLAALPEIESYDFVLFDAPPSFGPLTLNVLRATEEVVIPVPLTFLALDGCAELCRTLARVRAHHPDEPLDVTMVIPTFHRRTRLAAEVLEKLKKRFPKEIAQTVVGYHVRIDEAQSRSLSIFEYAPSDRGARSMGALAEELEARTSRATRLGAEG